MDRRAVLQKIKSIILHPLFRKLGAIFLAFFMLFFVALVTPRRHSDGSAAPGWVLGTTFLMAILWITNQLHPAITALLPVFLFPVLGVMSGAYVACCRF